PLQNNTHFLFTRQIASMADRNGSNVRKSFESFFNGWLVRQENFLDQPVQALTSQDGHEIEQRGSLVQEVLSHYEQYLEEKSKAAKDQVFLFYSPPCSVTELTPEQEETIERVKYETRKEERELTEAMGTVKKVIEILSPVQTVKFLAASAEFQLRVRKWGLQKDQHRATGLRPQSMARSGTVLFVFFLFPFAADRRGVMEIGSRFYSDLMDWGTGESVGKV
ncbi:Transcription factor TGA like domain - like 8, partial [Theobroma cacao]